MQLTEYSSRKPYVLVPSIDSVTCSVNLIFEEREKIPENFSLIIGDAIHNLRSALDILVIDIFKSRGLEVDGRIGFPIAQSENAFEKIIRKGEFKKLDMGILEIFRNFKPFRSGSVLLAGLHDLDIEDKHKRLLFAVAYSDFQTLMQFVIPKKGTVHGSSAVGNIIRVGTGFGITPYDHFDIDKEYDVKIQVVFSESVFEGATVANILKDMCGIVEEIVQSIEDHLRIKHI